MIFNAALDALCFGIALAVVLVLTPALKRLASTWSIYDHVDERRMHLTPKPRIGGVAVFLAFSTSLFIGVGIGLRTGRFGPDETHALLGVIAGGIMITAGGLWDDLMPMRPHAKLGMQLFVVLVSTLYGFRIEGVQNIFEHGAYIVLPAWASVVVTVTWYLGMINAMNFIDGLDGLLPGVAVISGLFLAVIAATTAHAVVAVCLFALIAAALGFLRYNFNPASIILGDSGSQFIGFVFATASIIGASKGAATISLAFPLLILGVPVFDTAAAIARRIGSGRSIASADKAHLHHMLVFRCGLSVRQAVLTVYAMCFILGIFALVLFGVVTPNFWTRA